MAPFIVNHPTLLNNWILSREIALKEIREIKNVNSKDADLFKKCFKGSLKNITSWNSESEFQIKKINSLLFNLKKFLEFIEDQLDFSTPYPFNQIYLWLEKETCEETIEYIVSMMMEPFDKIVQPLIKKMSSDEEKYFRIPTERTVLDLKNILKQRYPDILKIDFKDKSNLRNFWFISKNKEEPRYADRFEEGGAELEQPLAIARDIKKLNDKLISCQDDLTIDRFLMNNADSRHVVRRAFIVEKFPYAEIQDNTISENVVPIDMSVSYTHLTLPTNSGV